MPDTKEVAEYDGIHYGSVSLGTDDGPTAV